MPANRLPDHYGIADQSSFPAGIAGPFAYPFRK
jgi:hypothetical protein